MTAELDLEVNVFCPLSPAPAHRPGHARSHAHAGGRTPRPWSSWRHVPTRERHCGTRAVQTSVHTRRFPHGTRAVQTSVHTLVLNFP